LLKVNAVKLLDRHPNYGKDVTAYIKENPHATLRQLLVLMAANAKVGTHLIFDHALGGGANIYTNELREKYVEEGKNVLLVQYDFYSHTFTLSHRYKIYDFKFKISNFSELQTFINKLHLREVFINNLVSYANTFELLDYIYTLISKNTTNLILPIHDFYTLSPSYNLLNEEGKYNLQDCLDNTKMSANMQEWRNFYSDDVDMPKWKAIWTKLFDSSHKVLCFSNSSKNIVLEAYPSIEKKITVSPHIVECISPIVLEKDPNKTITTIGVLGAIDYVKGAQIVKQIVQLIDRNHLDIHIVVIGEITEQISSKHFKVTGRYKRKKLPQLIEEHKVDIFLIPSIIPETFSYTTQEIIMMEQPLMVFDLGAPAERVAKYDKGYIIEEISAKAILEVIKKFQAKIETI
ncbi:MAG TPA: glycosyltransferase, partial [Flavobacteriaceae bacterium]|nr:glycosyltransferase [Flavobacteriaceae bacterium]